MDTHQQLSSKFSCQRITSLPIAVTWSAIAVILSVSTVEAQEKVAAPSVMLIGDSIRLSYAPIVTEHFKGRAAVISPAANGGDSGNVLKNLDRWLPQTPPKAILFNCGIHDTKKFRSTGQFQVSAEQYAENLRKVVARLRAAEGTTVLFATSTPIIDSRAARSRADRDYELLDASIQQYNEIARRIMQEMDVQILDLHAVLTESKSPTLPELIGDDGVHLTPAGRDLVGQKVAEFVGQQLR